MTRWLVAPLLCAMTLPSQAWAQQPASPPTAEPGAAEIAAPAEAAAETPAEAAPESPAEVPAESPTSAVANPFDQPSLESSPAPQAAPVPPPPPPVMVNPAPAPAPQGPQLDKRAEPLLAAGLGSFAALYGLTAYVGAATIDRARDIGRDEWSDGDGKMTRNRGRALLIPVAGPFIAMHFTGSARRKYWQAVNGGLQAGTLAMALIGARMYGKHRRAKRRAQFTASAGPQGAQLGMAMRF